MQQALLKERLIRAASVARSPYYVKRRVAKPSGDERGTNAMSLASRWLTGRWDKFPPAEGLCSLRTRTRVGSKKNRTGQIFLYKREGGLGRSIRCGDPRYSRQ